MIRLLSEHGADCWLEGGWEVDALLGQETRLHKDLDLIVTLDHVPTLIAALSTKGFAIREGAPPSCFVLATDGGLEVDVHPVQFDRQGNGVYLMQDGQEWIYPADGFKGIGLVAGQTVRCLTPEVQVLCHAHGYIPTAKDFQDMAHLDKRFSHELPAALTPNPATPHSLG